MFSMKKKSKFIFNAKPIFRNWHPDQKPEHFLFDQPDKITHELGSGIKCHCWAFTFCNTGNRVHRCKKANNKKDFFPSFYDWLHHWFGNAKICSLKINYFKLEEFNWSHHHHNKFAYSTIFTVKKLKEKALK